MRTYKGYIQFLACILNGKVSLDMFDRHTGFKNMIKGTAQRDYFLTPIFFH
jgi:hypothetical protein